LLSGDAVEHPQIIDPKLEVGQLRRPPQRESVARTYGRVIFLQARLDRVPEPGSVSRGELAELPFRIRRDPDPAFRHKLIVVLIRTTKQTPVAPLSNLTPLRYEGYPAVA
jgi:hypothetical protein